MSKEINSKGNILLEKKKNRLDSLNALFEKTSQSDVKLALMKEIINGRQEIEAFSNNYMLEESQKINDRLRGYGTDFIKDKKYKIILGTDSHTLIAYDDALDVTDEFIIYINSRYEGNR
ncbi:hypothetical protein ACLI09_12290 [Flavobacterium sp. RHBU_24]|uniref:hypothetical protein n=1 Tax=Flavobacterium sp. RHBU_24 TaxID=3391185 RepID=UPI0039856B32